jgi:uncharacterized protein YbbK (DUF523 family)
MHLHLDTLAEASGLLTKKSPACGWAFFVKGGHRSRNDFIVTGTTLL